MTRPPKAAGQGGPDAPAGSKELLDSSLPGRRRVLVTRPERDAAQWVASLQRLGFAAQSLPLIAIAPVNDPLHVLALKSAWIALPSYSACMFVSGNAVEHFFKPKELSANAFRASNATNIRALNDVEWLLPPTLRCLAPGPGTAAALIAAGVAPSQIDAPPADAEQFDSAALWQVIGNRDWRDSKVLVVRGLTSSTSGGGESSGRDWITRKWLDAGAVVESISVYQRQAPILGTDQLKRARTASTDGSIWIFSSSEAVSNLAAIMRACSDGAGDSQSGLSWLSSTAVATHPRIADTLQAMGWGRVVESRPSLSDIATTLASLAPD